MDGLSIITGFAFVSFLLFYLSFSLKDEHIFLKLFLIFAGLFLLLGIPQASTRLEQDCTILNTGGNGTHICYLPNGSVANNQQSLAIGTTFLKSYMTILYVCCFYILFYLGYLTINKVSLIIRHKRGEI